MTKFLRTPGRKARRVFAALGVAALPVFYALWGCAPAMDRKIQDPRARVTHYLDALIEDDREVGLQYLVVSDQGVVLEYSGGLMDAASVRPVTSDTTFLTASSTKVLTAAAVLKLVEQGKLELDAPLARYLPDQPYGAELTIRQLLNHSAGVPNPMPVRWVHTRAEHESFDERRALQAVLDENPELDAEPGERYAYSNLGYWLLGEAIEATSGLSFCAYLRAQVFEPLGIARSELDCEVESFETHARGHQTAFSLLGLALPLMTDDAIWDDDAGKWARFQHLHMNGPAYGGVVGSARGFAKFLGDLVRPESRLLGARTKQLLFEEQQSSSGELLPTALGWHRGELSGTPRYSKPGGGPGFSANLRIYPEQRLASVFLSNRMRVSESEIEEFSDVLDREILAARAAAGARR